VVRLVRATTPLTMQRGSRITDLLHTRPQVIDDLLAPEVLRATCERALRGRSSQTRRWATRALA
jgi:hypothetical protein